MPPAPGILLTAFEPSGDEHAAGLIAAIRRARPELQVWAMGGPKMAAAGAQMIENTAEGGVMLLGAISQFRAHRARLKRLERWMADHPLAALVPVDSPAANWSVCKLVRRKFPKAKIVHLVGPQLWAWAPWRIGKLRRLTDHVLCLLPFEPEWFGSRGVKATFVGHPLFDERRAGEAGSEVPADEASGSLPVGWPRLALLPGSRKSEIQNNWPVMARAAVELGKRFPGLCLAAAVRDRMAADLVEAEWFGRAGAGGDETVQRVLAAEENAGGYAGTLPGTGALCVRIGQIDRVLEWADVALVVSGTATLRVASHFKPMVVIYRVSPLTWNLGGRFVVQTRTFTLPNLISESLGNGRAVVELVPHFGEVRPVVEALEPLLADPSARARQADALRAVVRPFAGHKFGEEACRAFLAELEGG